MSAHARHVPLRRCVVCRTSHTKADLVRLIHDDTGWRPDPERAFGGRGTWVCHACIAAAAERDTRRAFGRAFRQHADEVVALLGRPGDSAAVGPVHPLRPGGTHG